ncbi:hypothetical protein LTR70_001575 [Exophiala xenobiotica]|uniref:P-loop containing nucleoside triphosphate hydrolase protein n=1 Tax=Lithohypha guttulata TaxID=1690604 RepID=A0ABR0KD77_9EURO|nr:hypothetical protein LTR24_003978 [Lithohypha guttulata]KAK5327952.1 hypothetical protein LTR70_001575 [Exophiala xenobiotica]
MRRCFTTSARLLSHENPLGLPRRAPPAGPAPTLRGAPRGLPPKRRIAHVDHVIAVSSAKGGVGKSTLAVNLALAFSRHNLRTGILDADIFGPSIPTLLNLADASEPEVTNRGSLVPLQSYGLKSMSIGYLLPSEAAPVAWRGAMVQKALHQLLHEVDWSPKLDVLVLDLPPGTGDVQLTIGQQVELSGAVVVSTPQDIALKDAVRGVGMFNQMKIPVLGLVQNIGGKVQIQDMNIDLLGKIPLDPNICHDADAGKPTVVAEEASGKLVNTKYYESIASKVAQKVGLTWT